MNSITAVTALTNITVLAKLMELAVLVELGSAFGEVKKEHIIF
jgi:hypothetical protein